MIRNYFVRVFLFVTIVYWLTAIFVEGDTLILIANSLFVGIAVAVVVSWWPDAWQALKNGGHEGYQRILVAPVGLFSAFIVLRIWSAVSRAIGFPEWMVNSPVIGYCLVGAAAASSLYLSAPGTSHGITPPRNWRWIIVAVSMGMLFAGIAIGTAFPRPSDPEGNAFNLSTVIPRCSDDRPVWGNTKSGVYHEKSSPYRSLIAPTRCFKTTQEAEVAGFRAPR